MLKQLMLVCSLGVVSLPVFAEVMLQTPEEINVVAIDDQEIHAGLIKGKRNSFKLDAGQHTISVKYQDIYYHNDGEHDVVKSNVVTLNQVPFKDGEEYQLTLLNAPKEFEQAKKFAEQPTIAIKNASGQIIAQQTGASSQSKSWLSNGIFGSITDLRQKNNQPITIKQTTATQATTNSNVVNPSAASSNVTHLTNGQSTRDQQLIELWKNATPQERQRFTAWLAEQASK